MYYFSFQKRKKGVCDGTGRARLIQIHTIHLVPPQHGPYTHGDDIVVCVCVCVCVFIVSLIVGLERVFASIIYFYLPYNSVVSQ